MITRELIEQHQKNWGEAIVKIGEYKTYSKECNEFTLQQIEVLYDFSAPILFKPTKASIKPFRSSKTAALSYFIGGNTDFSEDKGFALNPWTKVRFENDQIKIKENSALAMGHYYFTTTEGSEVKVEYSFGYSLVDGQLKVDLHHSSLPYNPI